MRRNFNFPNRPSHDTTRVGSVGPRNLGIGNFAWSLLGDKLDQRSQQGNHMYLKDFLISPIASWTGVRMKIAFLFRSVLKPQVLLTLGKNLRLGIVDCLWDFSSRFRFWANFRWLAIQKWEKTHAYSTLCESVDKTRPLPSTKETLEAPIDWIQGNLSNLAFHGRMLCLCSFKVCTTSIREPKE